MNGVDLAENYRELVLAIVTQAVRDLKEAYKRRDKSEARRIENELKKFGLLEYVTDLTARDIIKYCKESVKNGKI